MPHGCTQIQHHCFQVPKTSQDKIRTFEKQDNHIQKSPRTFCGTNGPKWNWPNTHTHAAHTHLLLHPVFVLDVEAGVEQQGLLDERALVQPPDEQVLGSLDAENIEVPQMQSGQHEPDPPSHCGT